MRPRTPPTRSATSTLRAHVAESRRLTPYVDREASDDFYDLNTPPRDSGDDSAALLPTPPRGEAGLATGRYAPSDRRPSVCDDWPCCTPERVDVWRRSAFVAAICVAAAASLVAGCCRRCGLRAGQCARTLRFCFFEAEDEDGGVEMAPPAPVYRDDPKPLRRDDGGDAGSPRLTRL